MRPDQEKNSLQGLIGQLPERTAPVEAVGVAGSAAAYLLASVHEAHRFPLLVVSDSPRSGRRFCEELAVFTGENSPAVAEFMPYNLMPFEFMAYHNQTAAHRIRLLYTLITQNRPLIVITTPQALCQRIIPRPVLSDWAELLMEGEETERDGLINKLIAGGYSRAAIVEEPGDFAVRGGIVDLFSPLYDDPLRIEFFGDTVESLRFFSAGNQRSLRRIGEAVILPARETLIQLERTDGVLHRIRQEAARQGMPAESARDFTEKIRHQGVFPGMESLLPLIYEEPGTLFDYLPEQTLFVLSQPPELDRAAERFQGRLAESHQSALAENRLCPDPQSACLSWEQAQQRIFEHLPLILKSLPTQDPRCQGFAFRPEENHALRDQLMAKTESRPLSPLVQWIEHRREQGYLTLLVCFSASRQEQLAALLAEYGIAAERHDHLPRFKHRRGRVCICSGSLKSGFVWPEAGVAVVTETEIFGGKRRSPSAKKSGVRTELLAFESLKQGELVVHSEHGIGRYQGLQKLELNGSGNDFLCIAYQDDDKLYVPVDRMQQVQKYLGVDGIVPVLDKMGGKSWEKARRKAKKSVEKIAGELLNLYAARKVVQGHRFDVINAYFREFEAGFPYAETPDQRQAIEAVLDDLARSEPMDRLVCGDVGYGKTEVALRASFTVVNSGKQVAVLVPTTVLAEQHYATFCERYQDYPVVIECISRFRAPRQQKAILRDLAAGKVDILIGTHRLLQKDVAFKELGLIVVDEEQRFGVRHKEKLKTLRQSVDVLALTATPIPRTLHLSLMGIRDISVISTPPEDRRPIITYVSQLDDGLVRQAVQKEMARGGQCFFIHNHVKSIERMTRHLQGLLPEAKIAMAHGQMEEKALEKVMLAFSRQEVDLLVCTTIVESGLDIPSANTILINRADRLGLAQIYQLRGRVGRSEEQAYAYLFIPPESNLSKDAQKRLKVLMEHSDLGSGFQIAMSDLRIRGGGAILGASQSGHIAAVGYDMFLQLMEQAIADLKGQPIQDPLDPEINLGGSAFFSETYIPDIDQRLAAYRRLAKMGDLQEIADFKAELKDRFGPLPEEAGNLLLKIMLKVLAVKAGVKRLDINGEQLGLWFSPQHQKNPLGLVELVRHKGNGYQFTPDQGLKVRLEKKGGPLAQAKKILKEVSQHVNN